MISRFWTNWLNIICILILTSVYCIYCTANSFIILLTNSSLTVTMERNTDPLHQINQVSLERPKRRARTRHWEKEARCSVCGAEPGPHVYYGARVGRDPPGLTPHCTSQACLPCRAFFKRSVEDHKALVCYRSQECEVTHINRRCKYCRFQVGDTVRNIFQTLTPHPPGLSPGRNEDELCSQTENSS